jgi:hypothetical protein
MPTEDLWSELTSPYRDNLFEEVYWN